MKFDGCLKVWWLCKSLMVILKIEGYDYVKVWWNVVDMSVDCDVWWGWNNNFVGVMLWWLFMLFCIGNLNLIRMFR